MLTEMALLENKTDKKLCARIAKVQMSKFFKRRHYPDDGILFCFAKFFRIL